jgi:hypothetical protein
VKYVKLKLFPIDSNGCSTGLAPIQVRITKLLISIQKIDLVSGVNFFDFRRVFVNVNREITKMENTKATTPPNLLGIERRIA